MKEVTVYLKEQFDGIKTDAFLTCFYPLNPLDQPLDRPNILILPGGAYVNCSRREGEAAAYNFLAQGYNVFVLTYSIQTQYPAQILEALASVAYIKSLSNDETADISSFVCVLGFSAGGHLAASASCLYKDESLLAVLGLTPAQARADAAILCYPVITMGKYTHGLSKDTLTGQNDALADELSMERRVHKDVPPTFIWTTANDNIVPAQNSLLYAKALADNGIPFELHVFPNGWHGLANCNYSTGVVNEKCEQWIRLSVDWLKEIL